MLGMNLKLNHYSILLSMCFIRYGSTFIQQLCWVVCISFCKNQSITTLFSYYFVIHITAKPLIVMNELKVKLYGFIVCGLK